MWFFSKSMVPHSFGVTDPTENLKKLRNSPGDGGGWEHTFYAMSRTQGPLGKGCSRSKTGAYQQGPYLEFYSRGWGETKRVAAGFT